MAYDVSLSNREGGHKGGSGANEANSARAKKGRPLASEWRVEHLSGSGCFVTVRGWYDFMGVYKTWIGEIYTSLLSLKRGGSNTPPPSPVSLPRNASALPPGWAPVRSPSARAPHRPPDRCVQVRRIGCYEWLLLRWKPPLNSLCSHVFHIWQAFQVCLKFVHPQSL